MAGEAVVTLVHLHAWCMVIMKKTEGHPVGGDSLSIKFCSLSGGDGCGNGLINAYRRSSFDDFDSKFHLSITLYGENRHHSSKWAYLQLKIKKAPSVAKMQHLRRIDRRESCG